MASLYDANTNYQINGVDLRDNPGLVTREYLIDVYPSLIDNFRFAGLWGWGYNVYGHLGTDDLYNRSSPVQTIAGGTNWKKISTSGQVYIDLSLRINSFAAIKTDGTLWMWGYNWVGNLGDNSIVHRSSPVQTIAGGTNWKQVAASGQVTAAIKTDGTLWTWGYAAGGALGQNNTVFLHRSSPVQVGGNTNWKEVFVGLQSMAAIKTDGTLWVWGVNFNGGLGTNDIVYRSSPTQVGADTNWKQVSLNSSNSIAIKTDGTLWTWGYASSLLGDYSNVHRSSPVQLGSDTNWKQVSIASIHTAAIKTDGTLWTWGSGNYGNLGLGDITNRSSPTQVGTNTNWKQVSCGYEGTTAIKTDGTLWTWGRAIYGVLGTSDSTGANRSSPVQTIAGGTNWKQVFASGSVVLAIRDDSADPFRSEPL